MKLSVSMIVKNEFSCLAKCLETVKDADEIVIVDTGSTDDTVAIARQYTDKVFCGNEYLWRDDFAFSRNQSLGLCTGDWVLVIDADETLELGGIEKLREIMEHTNADALYLETVSAGAGTSGHWSIRVFRRDAGISWRGRIHNYLSTGHGDKVPVQIIYGYSEAHKADPDRALRILTDVVNTTPECKRERYYLAREYWYRKDYDTAVRWYANYLSVATWAPEIADAWLMLARCYWQLRQGDNARDACLQAIKINANFREACLFMAEMSGPKNRVRWQAIAETATDEDVLFVRAPRQQRGLEYYDRFWRSNPDLSRYDALYKRIAEIVGDGLLLDAGCGAAKLRGHLSRYCGFDFAEGTIARLADEGVNVWVGDVKDPTSYVSGADFYSLVEVLEHVEDDLAVLKALPVESSIIITVPSFEDPSHVRTYTEDSFRKRYSDLLRIEAVERFRWNTVEARWEAFAEKSHPEILLVQCELRSEVAL